MFKLIAAAAVMPRKLLMFAAMPVALALGGCPNTGNPQVDSVLTQAAGYANTLCGIEVDAAQVLSMVGYVNPTVSMIETIGTALCDIAASKTAAGRYGAPHMAVGGTRSGVIKVGGAKVRVTVRRVR